MEENPTKKVTLSALLKAARMNSQMEGYSTADVERDTHLWLSGAWNHDESLTLPEAHVWDEENPPPLDVLARLAGKEIRAPILVDYLDRTYLAVYIHFPREVEQSIRVGGVFTRDHAISVVAMTLVDAELVDMEVKRRHRRRV